MLLTTQIPPSSQILLRSQTWQRRFWMQFNSVFLSLQLPPGVCSPHGCHAFRVADRRRAWRTCDGSSSRNWTRSGRRALGNTSASSVPRRAPPSACRAAVTRSLTSAPTTISACRSVLFTCSVSSDVFPCFCQGCGCGDLVSTRWTAFLCYSRAIKHVNLSVSAREFSFG